MFKHISFFTIISLLFVVSVRGQVINIVYTSDAHYGITRPKFRGDTNVPSYRVNAAMINQMNI